MITPLLARQDESAVNQLRQSLPQALIIAAEPGLDSHQVAEGLANSQPSDVFIVKPQDGKKDITVAQIRDLVFSLRTYASRRRVAIIRLASDMNEAAQNALLKTLEEPSEGVHFILEVYDVNSLLATVISRCQILNLHRTSPLQDSSLLKKSQLDDKSKQQILFLAAGRPSLIRKLINQPKVFEKYQQLAIDAKQIIQNSSYESLVSAQKYSTSRNEALELVDVIMSMIRFQIRSTANTELSAEILEKAQKAERALKSNGHIKLALMQLVG